jgi:hypothetical protein
MDDTFDPVPIARDRAARRALAKVPEITIAFWLLKLLTTGMGEPCRTSWGNTASRSPR